MQEFKPDKIEKPARLIECASAWKGLESILGSVVDSFCAHRETAVEFGVEYGYSLVAMSNFFDKVIGVDTFSGDSHAGYGTTMEHAKRNTAEFENISLVKSDWREFANKNEDKQFDLIHVDIEHWFQTTYDCGLWAIHHAPVVLFHDTISFIDVLRTCKKLSEENNMSFYNYPLYNGLGILRR